MHLSSSIGASLANLSAFTELSELITWHFEKVKKLESLQKGW